MNELDKRLNDVFPGRVVRKDLVQRVKKGTNIPTFVLEFLLARYCASDDPDEIEAGIQAVVDTLQSNFVRPNEWNAAQSRVQQKGRHKFIDKVHVTHKEKEKRHWAEMENFNSRRIAINEKHYRENERLLEAGLWSEVNLGYNEVEDDDYTFFIEDLRPIQVSRFDPEAYASGRAKFTRDEWLDMLLQSIGLEASKLNKRQKFHFLARLFPFVESNYNFIELGPRGTGKSYVFSEFSPYSTLISGGQTTTATLFYNKARRQVGLIGYWDVIAFDEVAGIKVKDTGTIQILKDYMANGRFSLGTEVPANASLAFVGNIDDSVDQIVRSTHHDLFKPLPPSFDLAVIHRFHTYLPGWEIPPYSNELLTSNYGFITDYLAEAFHHLSRHVNKFTYVRDRAKLGANHEGRDETAVYKTVSAFLKLLHPGDEATDAEFEEYLEYAIEGRRRIKEQLNKRKNDDEFANIELSYTNAAGEEIVVTCPESAGIAATLTPSRGHLEEQEDSGVAPLPKTQAEEASPPASEEPSADPAEASPSQTPSEPAPVPAVAETPQLEEKHIDIHSGDRGFSYTTLFGTYLQGAKEVTVEDPYIRTQGQVVNFLRFCELCVEAGTIEKINLVTNYDHDHQKQETLNKLSMIEDSLNTHGVEMTIKFREFHDREIRTDHGWAFRLGRGLDFYKRPDDWLEIGANDLDLRECQATKISIIKIPKTRKE